MKFMRRSIAKSRRVLQGALPKSWFWLWGGASPQSKRVLRGASPQSLFWLQGGALPPSIFWLQGGVSPQSKRILQGASPQLCLFWSRGFCPSPDECKEHHPIHTNLPSTQEECLFFTFSFVLQNNWTLTFPSKSSLENQIIKITSLLY